MRSPRCRRDGAALLEALVALLVIAMVVTTSLQAMRDARDAGVRTQRRLGEVRAATSLFEAATLWTTADLDRHLGARRQGPWIMEVTRSRPALYTLTLSETDGRLLLRTEVYRPEEQDAR